MWIIIIKNISKTKTKILYQQWWLGETGTVKIFKVGETGVGKMGVGEMGQIIGETGVGEMGVIRWLLDHIRKDLFTYNFIQFTSLDSRGIRLSLKS